MTFVQTDAQRKIITESIENAKHVYIETSHAIHEKPEIGNREYFASQTLVDLLEGAGFRVTRNIAGHETGFVAKKHSGKPGPTIGFLAEYDALPGLGHACGHNIIGTASTAAGIALAEVIAETGGEVIVFGTPAEEGGPNGSAKGSFVDYGILEEVDACLMIHPSGKTSVTSPSLAVDPFDFHFYGKPAHAAASPEKGINALDAVIQLFNGINALRQQLPSDVKIHGIITHGGDAPNIIPEYASARFFIRAKTRKRCEEVTEKVKKVAEGAALATGATIKIEQFQNKIDNLLLNRTFDAVAAEELEQLGEIVHYEGRSGIGSTDAGNVSQVVPTIHPYIKIGPDDLIAHTDEFREAAGSKQGDKALIIAAKALAFTGYRLLTDYDVLQKIRAEFEVAKQAEER
ncbi:M20 family metallopeptidase [Ectobacillus panaciterrae]|uniref:M20 family metallopeptidase n=1 Tax=Ectobacillus panaciterrae TaxID=363872 RepID=UPI0003FF784E|nr:M20 family metallopeptidase [Ectobacillus panaciterrae]